MKRAIVGSVALLSSERSVLGHATEMCIADPWYDTKYNTIQNNTVEYRRFPVFKARASQVSYWAAPCAFASKQQVKCGSFPAELGD